jgi:hypothetical protein
MSCFRFNFIHNTLLLSAINISTRILNNNIAHNYHFRLSKMIREDILSPGFQYPEKTLSYKEKH